MEKKDTHSTPRIYVGLDIGTTKIATAVGYVAANGKTEYLDMGTAESTGVEVGIIKNILKTNACIKKSIERAEDRTGQKIQTVCAGVAGRHIKSEEYIHSIKRRNGKETIITEEEIDAFTKKMQDVLLDPDVQIIDVIPQYYIVDGRKTFEPVGEQGEIIEGHFQIVTGRQNDIRNIIQCINNAGIKVDEIILEPIASGIACLTEEEKRQGAILLDIGGGTTDISIYYEGVLIFTEVIPFGGNSITADIASTCNIPKEVAEKVKIEKGTCIEQNSNPNSICILPAHYTNSATQEISETYLAKIISMRVKQILGLVKQSIERCPEKDKLNAGIVLTGGGAALRDICALTQFELGRPTKVGVPGQGFGNTLPAKVKQPSFSTVCGLLSYAVSQGNGTPISDEVPNRQPIEESETHRQTSSSSKRGNRLWDSVRITLDNVVSTFFQQTE